MVVREVRLRMPSNLIDHGSRAHQTTDPSIPVHVTSLSSLPPSEPSSVQRQLSFALHSMSSFSERRRSRLTRRHLRTELPADDRGVSSDLVELQWLW